MSNLFTEPQSHDDDGLANLISLKLRKPKHWQWELTAARSNSNIALPRILLYDQSGELLVDANADAVASMHADGEAECVWRAALYERELSAQLRTLDMLAGEPSNSTSTTTTGTATSSSGTASQQSTAPAPAARRTSSRPSRHSSSSASVSVPANSERRRRRYCRSRSSTQSGSILERLSRHRGRYSSPETEPSTEPLSTEPRYFLRTSKIGTLLIPASNPNGGRQQGICLRRRHKSSTSASSTNTTICLPIRQLAATTLACSSAQDDDVDDDDDDEDEEPIVPLLMHKDSLRRFRDGMRC